MSLFSVKDNTSLLYMLSVSVFNLQIPPLSLLHSVDGFQGHNGHLGFEIKETWIGLRYLNQSLMMTSSLQSLSLTTLLDGDMNDEQVTEII